MILLIAKNKIKIFLLAKMRLPSGNSGIQYFKTVPAQILELEQSSSRLLISLLEARKNTSKLFLENV